ncbi:MAG: F0F1 ATP synthase subunit A [Planctomycetota bacterium]
MSQLFSGLGSGLLPAAANPVDHVVNHSFVTVNGWWLWSAQTGTLLLAGLLTIIVGLWLAKHVATGPESEGHDRYITKNPVAHMLEVIAGYLREQVVRPMLHERTDRFMPFLWTLFFFILFNNMLGLVPLLDVALLVNKDWKSAHMAPIGGTATQNLFVTAVLAIFSGIVINYAGVKELGVKGYLHHLTGGAPRALWPLMVLIETIGIIIKPVALALRLFANMTAGHILLAALLGFVGSSIAGLGLLGSPIALVAALGALAVYFLEIFVGFLQAFIFMFLTTVFISLLSHHGDEHGHDDHHAHEPAHA